MSNENRRLANAVLWPGFFGTTAPEWLLSELGDGLAGVVYFRQNISADTASLSAQIRAANPLALIGVDEEGGGVTRLEAEHGSTLPGAAQLGALDDVAATTRTGAEIARRLREVGANVALGPVADVNTNPENPVIGVRAFGDNPATVARHVAAQVVGVQEAGIAACVKHFPGHGDTHHDSHHALPVLDLDPEVIDRDHAEPFRVAIAAGVDAVMTAHIVVPAWGDAPATLNPIALNRLREAGFAGVIISDALDMAAIREQYGMGQGAVRALAAGVDLLCTGNPTNPRADAAPDQDYRDFREVRDAIVGALESGELSPERVADAARRVGALAVKRRTSAHPAAHEPDDLTDIVRRSIRGVTAAPEPALAVIDARRSSSLAVDSAATYVAQELAAADLCVRIDVASASATDVAAALSVARAAGGRIVILADRLNTEAAQRDLVRSMADDGAAVVNVGLAVVEPLGVEVIEVGAASRLGAQIARERLCAP